MLDSLWLLSEATLHEIILLAAVGFLLIGISDFAVDVIWIGRTAWRFFTGQREEATIADIKPLTPGRIAIFVPAWDEAAVIKPMLRNTLASYSHPNFRVYVGCYPNDPTTLAAVEDISDSRLRIVVNAQPGPTTKADCLNQIWVAMKTDEMAEGRQFDAIVLHDAEDVVHRDELNVVDGLIRQYDLVQLPVLPLINRRRMWISGHYADEFAESHGKELVVREAVGAAIPSAGVSSGISPAALRYLEKLEGTPFDATSVTEDYELGLRLKSLGFRTSFMRVRDADGGLVGTRAYFPDTITTAVQQKSRWILGTALSGWDRLSWSGHLGERWMRVRDRQAPFASAVLLIGYFGLFCYLVLLGFAIWLGLPQPTLTPTIMTLVIVNLYLLVWRLLFRAGFTTNNYGLRQGLVAIPRVLVSNFIAVLAARRGLRRYVDFLKGKSTEWGKTAHVFPVELT